MSRPAPGDPRAQLRERAAALGILALAAFAYRPLLLGALEWPGLGDVEQWFFATEEKTPLLAIGVAGWMLWRRRGRLAALPDERATGRAAALLLLGAGLFVWGHLTRTADLLLPSLAANLLALACATKGSAGVRGVVLPAFVLLLGVPIPGPLRSELVWQLQLWSAQLAARVLAGTGHEIAFSGVQLLDGEFSFTVIDSCSGMRGIEILILVAFAIRELFAAGGRRQWLVVALAPAVGFALNQLRIVLAVLSTSGVDPAQAEPGAWDHTVEGVAALAIGTALLYGFAWTLAGREGRRRSAALVHRPTQALRTGPQRRWAAAALAALGVVSVAVPPFPPVSGGAELVDLPLSLAGWEGERLVLDRVFFGPVYAAQAAYLRYEKPGSALPRSVEILVATELPDSPSDDVFSRRAVRPGYDWSLKERRSAEFWTLRAEGELAVASRHSELALVYSWRVRDRGILWHALRSLLGLDRAPLLRGRPRAVVRLATPLLRDGPLAINLARRTLDDFISDFADELAAL